MSKRRLWTLENNLSFALFSSFASRKRRRCVRFEKRNLSLVSPLAKSLKMRTNKLATLFRSSTRSFSSFKERERNYYDGKTVLVSLLLSFSLSFSVCLCVNVCRWDYAGKNALLLISHQTLSNNTSRLAWNDARSETKELEFFHPMSTNGVRVTCKHG